MRRVHYDRSRKRLVYIDTAADEAFWDERWADRLTIKDISNGDRFVLTTTRRWLPLGSKVIDAGCGAGRTVYGLHKAGYDAWGLDYAPSTITALNRLAPELNIVLGDIHDLPFDDQCFDGVWSLGVVEHYYDGFSKIVQETARVLKVDGYAFVTVPSMSPLRRLKARLGLYPEHDGSTDGFYQFALSPSDVVKGFEEHGFRYVSGKGRGGYLGLKEEVPLLRAPLEYFYNSKFKPFRAIRYGLDEILAPFSFHTRLYVFQKNTE